MSAIHTETVPRGALLGAAAVIAVALTAAIGARVTGMAPLAAPVATAESVSVRHLQFLDAEDGSVLVRDADTGARVQALAPGEGGFVRGTLRGLARGRRQHAVPADAPFRVTLFADGRVWLEDPATDQRIDLGAFGADNLAAFAAFLTTEEMS